MQVVFEILSALATSVTVIDAKDLQFRPLLRRDPRLLLSRLDHVEDDRDPVLIGFTDDSDISVRCEGFD